MVAALCVCALPSCIATPIAADHPASASRKETPEVVTLRPVVQKPVDAFPTHFDAKGKLFAHCGETSCDVWERGPEGYRGTIGTARCSHWVEPVPAPADQSPDGVWVMIHRDGNILLRAGRTGDVHPLIDEKAASGCSVGEALWSADDASLAYRCGSDLVFVDAKSATVRGRVPLPPATSLRYVWRDRLVIAPRDDNGANGALPNALLSWSSWSPPGPPANVPVDWQGQPVALDLDPVTAAPWRATVLTKDCASDALDGPDGEHWQAGREGKECGTIVHSHVLAWTPAADSFLLLRRDESPLLVKLELSVVRLRAGLDNEVLWQASYAHKEAGAPETVPELHAALSRDGAWAVFAADATPGGARTLTLVRAGTKEAKSLDLSAVPAVFHDAPAEAVDLSDDQLTALLTIRGVVFTVGVDGRSKSSRPSPRELSKIKRRERTEPAFSTSDGELFTRVSDRVTLRKEGCWFPSGWDDPPLTGVRILAGDPIDGQLLERKEVQALFCATSRFDAFLHGDPMPARPEAKKVLFEPAK
jgi:hypothetical protein